MAEILVTIDDQHGFPKNKMLKAYTDGYYRLWKGKLKKGVAIVSVRTDIKKVKWFINRGYYVRRGTVKGEFKKRRFFRLRIKK